MANETNLIDFGQVEDQSSSIIKVIGVGGGGCNAVNNMYREGIVNVSFAVCNTDSQSLAKSPVPVKVQLGEGLGAGSNPDKGRAEAENNLDAVERLFDDNTKMCFITAGMGGGTGTGAAPVVARMSKNRGILTIGIVTIPFFFEKRNKIIKALRGVVEMRKNVDSLLIINNERLCDIYADADVTVKEAFGQADRILSDATKSISELITVEGNVNLDFRDVEATMHGGGGALIAMGRASGERRVQNAILDALNSPLLYGSDISKAKNILFNIYTSSENPLFVKELQEIDAFMYELDPNIDVIWGTSDDDTLGEDAKVVILATGLDNEFMPREHPHENEQEYYDTVINKLYREGPAAPIITNTDDKPATDGKPVDDETPRTNGETVQENTTDADTTNTTDTDSATDTDRTPKPEPAIKPEPEAHDNKSAADGERSEMSFVDRVKLRIKIGLSRLTNADDDE